MPQERVTLNFNTPLVYRDGTATPYLQTQLLKLAAAIPIIGSGSPEGAVLAPVYSLYIDETDPLVPVQYRKMLDELSGDRKNGWVQL